MTKRFPVGGELDSKLVLPELLGRDGTRFRGGNGVGHPTIGGGSRRAAARLGLANGSRLGFDDRGGLAANNSENGNGKSDKDEEFHKMVGWFWLVGRRRDGMAAQAARHVYAGHVPFTGSSASYLLSDTCVNNNNGSDLRGDAMCANIYPAFGKVPWNITIRG